METNELLPFFIKECESIVEQVQKDRLDADKARDMIDYCHYMIVHLSEYFNLLEMFDSREPTEEEKKKYKKYEDEYTQLHRIFSIPGVDSWAIFNDDYGQCFDLLLNGELRGLGTYNLDISGDVFYLLLIYYENYFKKQLIS